MIRKLVTFVCIAILAFPAAAQSPAPTIQEQVSRMKQGSYVSVKSTNGNVIKGRLLSSSATAMDIQPNDKKVAPMSIAYSDIESVQRLASKQATVIGFVSAAAGVTALVVYLLLRAGLYPHD